MQASYKVLAVAGGIFATTILFGFITFHPIFTYMVKYQTSLRPNNMMRKYYLKLPMALDFRVYFFNVTNPSEVAQGATPVLKEIGPYCYDAYKEKIDVVDNDTDDSLTYTPFETYFFNPECSGNLNPDDHVTIIHPLIVGIVNMVTMTAPAFLATVGKAMNSIFHEPKDIYLTETVRNILFDGFIVNCTVKDFPGKAVCSQLKSQGSSSLVEVEQNVYRFSLLGSRNGTIPKRIKIHRGIDDSKDLGRVLEVDGESNIDIWSTEECNTFHGTDGWIFPPFLEGDKIWSYAHDLCRSVYMSYAEEAEMHGVKVLKFNASLGDQSTKEEDKCYCSSPEKCLPKGVYALTKCLKAPIYATLPHFFDTDEKYLTQVKGLTPDEEKHGLRGYFVPLLGTPLDAQKRIQLNLEIFPVEKVEFMKSLPEALHPILWFEEGVILKGDLLRQVTSVFMLVKIVTIIKYLFLACSIVGLAVGGYMFYKDRDFAKITPVKKIVNPADKTNQNISLNGKNFGREQEIGHDNEAMEFEQNKF